MTQVETLSNDGIPRIYDNILIQGADVGEKDSFMIDGIERFVYKIDDVNPGGTTILQSVFLKS